MSQVLILASSSTHDDAYDHHTTHNNRNVKFAMKNLRVRGCFFFFWVGAGGKGGRRDSNFLIRKISWWSWSESGSKKDFPRFPQTQNSNEVWSRVRDPVCKMFYFGFQERHESKLKNKRGRSTPGKSQKREERERGEGKGGKTKKEAAEIWRRQQNQKKCYKSCLDQSIEVDLETNQLQLGFLHLAWWQWQVQQPPPQQQQHKLSYGI